MAAKKPAAKPAKQTTAKQPAAEQADVTSTALTADTALALLTKLSFSEAEAKAALAAKDVPAAVLGQLAKVSVSSIAAAFPDEVVQALLAPGCSIKVKAPQLAKLADSASRAQTAATVSSKLSQGASVMEHSARDAADALDAIVHLIHPQIVSQMGVDDSLSETFKPVLAYWADRYPGHAPKAKASAPKT